jgi:hypothetical protein
MIPEPRNHEGKGPVILQPYISESGGIVQAYTNGHHKQAEKPNHIGGEGIVRVST